MNTVVFLGAGASKAFGYPLTAELLPNILRDIEAGRLFRNCNEPHENEEDRGWFDGRLRRFFPGLRDGGEQGVGITDLMTLVDHAIASGTARADMGAEELHRFRRLLERALYEALVMNQVSDEHCRGVQGAFGDWLSELAGEGALALVTTNYDLSADFELIRRLGGPGIEDEVDFGFAWRRVSAAGELVARPARPRCQILKMHGSLNWLQCPLCGQIYANFAGDVSHRAFVRELNDLNTCHCTDLVRLRVPLVTPSLAREYRDPQLLGVWQAALEALRTADRWYMIGYSLPPEDVAIRELLLRAWDGRPRMPAPKVTVVQHRPPDLKGSTQTERIYRAFFPRETLSYHEHGLEAFLAGPGAG